MIKLDTNRNDTLRIGSGQQEFRECTLCGDAFVDYPGCVLVTDNRVYELCEMHLKIHADDPAGFYKLLDLFLSRGMPISSLGVVL